MADRYSWQETSSAPSYRSTGQDHLGWWAAAAMFVSILLHVIVFFALDQVKFALGIDSGSPEIVTERVVVKRQVEDSQEYVSVAPQEDTPIPKPQTDKLLDEIDILQALPKNEEMDLSPRITDPTYAIQMATPAASGDPTGATLKGSSSGIDIDNDLPELGRSPDSMRPAAPGQITVDPGSSRADDEDLARFTNDMVKRGNNGKAPNGVLEGISSLDDLIGLPANELMGKKTMLPSDLLFEFNKYQLRDSAKFGLQKLGVLIDTNPEMYCWIEGHTDLIGSDVANLELSQKRAEAVKEYLVNSMRIDGRKIVTRGFGEYEPIVTAGDQNEQAPNRRVEIKMRKSPPTEKQIAPPKASAIEEMPPAPVAPPKADPVIQDSPARPVKVMPNPQRAIPVEVVPSNPAPAPAPPKATPIQEGPPPAAMIPRALPIGPEPAPARALPVEEAPVIPRAQPIQE